MQSRAPILLVCVSLAAALHAGLSGVSTSSVPLLYTLAREYSPLAWMQGGERFPQGAAIFLREGESRRALVPGFAASADASVSFDGKTVLFAGKQGRRGKSLNATTIASGRFPCRPTESFLRTRSQANSFWKSLR